MIIRSYICNNRTFCISKESNKNVLLRIRHERNSMLAISNRTTSNYIYRKFNYNTEKYNIFLESSIRYILHCNPENIRKIIIERI